MSYLHVEQITNPANFVTIFMSQFQRALLKFQRKLSQYLYTSKLVPSKLHTVKSTKATMKYACVITANLVTITVDNKSHYLFHN